MFKLKKTNCSIFGLPTVALILSYSLSVLYLSKIGLMRLVGGAAAILIVITGIGFVLVNSRNIKVNKTIYILLVFFFTNSALLITNFRSDTLYIWSQQLVLMTYVTCLSSIQIQDHSIRLFRKYFSSVYYLTMLVISFLIVTNSQYQLSQYFADTAYKVVFALSFFALLDNRRQSLFLIISCLIFLAIGERSTAIVIVIVYIVYKVLSLLKNSGFAYMLFYWVIACAVSFFPKLYVWLSLQPIARTLNTVSMKYFGARFFSGRNVLWTLAYESLEGKELFGLGIRNFVSNDYGYSLSIHNLYVYLILQGGYVLLLIFLVFMSVLWGKYFSGLSDDRVRLSASYFIGIMLLVSFDLLLIVNNFVVSLFLWLVIGIGLMISNSNCLACSQENKSEVHRSFV